MSNFGKIYSIITVLLLMAIPILGVARHMIAGTLFAVIWVAWNFYALAKFQRANISLKAPMCCALMIAVPFQFGAMGAVAGEGLSQLFYALATLFFVVFILLYFFLLKAVFFMDNSDSTLRLSEKPEPREIINEDDPAHAPSFAVRLAAGLIDGVFLGIASALILSLVVLIGGMALAAAHPEFDMSKISLGPAAMAGFAVGIISPFTCFTNLLASLSAISKALQASGAEGSVMLIGYLGLIIVNTVAVLYFTVMESSRNRASFGKLFVGLEVTNLAGEPLTRMQALRRCIFRSVCVGTFGLGYLYAAVSPTKQGLHDLLAKTVVRKKSLSVT